MSEDRISAGELRLLGVPVPLDVPDCATVRRASIDWGISTPAPSQDEIAAGSMVIDFKISFTEPFQWVEATVVVANTDQVTRQPSDVESDGGEV